MPSPVIVVSRRRNRLTDGALLLTFCKRNDRLENHRDSALVVVRRSIGSLQSCQVADRTLGLFLNCNRIQIAFQRRDVAFARN